MEAEFNAPLLICLRLLISLGFYWMNKAMTRAFSTAMFYPPFYRLQIKRHHALAKHVLPPTTSPRLFSTDTTVDCKTVRQSPVGDELWKACACVCVFYVCVQHSPVMTYKAVMCLRPTPHHQILEIEYLYWFLWCFYKNSEFCS